MFSDKYYVCLLVCMYAQVRGHVHVDVCQLTLLSVWRYVLIYVCLYVCLCV